MNYKKTLDLVTMIYGRWNTYQEYLCSEEWIDKRNDLINEVGQCQFCGISKKRSVYGLIDYVPTRGRYKGLNREKYGWTTIGKPLCCHHKSYERVGYERRTDFLVLCHDCHLLIHHVIQNFREMPISLECYYSEARGWNG